MRYEWENKWIKDCYLDKVSLSLFNLFCLLYKSIDIKVKFYKVVHLILKCKKIKLNTNEIV